MTSEEQRIRAEAARLTSPEADAKARAAAAKVVEDDVATAEAGGEPFPGALKEVLGRPGVVAVCGKWEMRELYDVDVQAMTALDTPWAKFVADMLSSADLGVANPDAPIPDYRGPGAWVSYHVMCRMTPDEVFDLLDDPRPDALVAVRKAAMREFGRAGLVELAALAGALSRQVGRYFRTQVGHEPAAPDGEEGKAARPPS